MIKLRGVTVYPTAIGPLLQSIPGVTGEYVCRISRVQNEMTILIEYDGHDAEASDTISRHLREQLGVRLSIELVAPGETAALTGLEQRQKPMRLIDDSG